MRASAAGHTQQGNTARSANPPSATTPHTTGGSAPGAMQGDGNTPTKGPHKTGETKGQANERRQHMRPLRIHARRAQLVLVVRRQRHGRQLKPPDKQPHSQSRTTKPRTTNAAAQSPRATAQRTTPSQGTGDRQAAHTHDHTHHPQGRANPAPALTPRGYPHPHPHPLPHPHPSPHPPRARAPMHMPFQRRATTNKQNNEKHQRSRTRTPHHPTP